MGDALPYRLPKTMAPTRYDLEVEPDLDAGTFSGRETVALQIKDTVTEVVMNGDGLQVADVVLSLADGRQLSGEPTVLAEEQQIVLRFQEPIAPGTATLSLSYSGTLADDLRGFYRTVLVGPDGSRTSMASTQCEATDARRVFPGWDEPEFKAVFAVSLVVDEGLAAFANGREVSRQPAASGKERVTFAETIPLSSYLVALAVGPFEAIPPVEVGRTPVRVLARPGSSHLTGMARSEAAAHLRFFEEYFAIAYPGDKLDHIAIPEFSAGAMENLGLVTYRDELLLLDAERASPMEMLNVSMVIAHETAHMWFGDLVTMRWWNGIWLNEAFATFMAMLAVDALHPDWEVWTTFGHGRAYALRVDGLESTRPIEYPVGRPAEAAGMFDTLTYEKGAAILRMLEQHLGPDVFREGIRHYLNAHRYANTETEDLWDALESVSGEPVRAMMNGWVLQGGYPVIQAERTGPETIELSARPFRYQGAGTGAWLTPVVMAVHRSDGQVERRSAIVGADPAVQSIPADVRCVVVNAGNVGFYRAAYDRDLLAATAAHLPELSGSERLGILDDVWASVVAGIAPLSQAVTLWRRLSGEMDPDVVETAAGQMAQLENVTDAAGRAALAGLVRATFGPALSEVGWAARPGEEVRQARRRASLVGLLGVLGDDAHVQHEARTLLLAHLEQGRNVPSELLSAAARITAHTGDARDWERLYQAFKRAATPQEETRYLYALSYVSQPDLARRTLELYLSDEVKLQDSALAIGRLLRSRYARAIAWQTVERHWDELAAKYPPQFLEAFYGPLADAVEDDLAARWVAFADAHPVAEILRQTEQAKEFARINRAFKERVGADAAAVAADA